MHSLQCRLARRLPRLGAVGLCWLIALVLNLTTVSLAHEGHDHNDAATEALASTAYPRIGARSDRYEIVGILKDGRLSIFVDDAITNEPVAGAALQVTIGDSAPLDAEQVERGVYAVSMPPLKTDGSIEVIFSINAEKGDDLLIDSFTPPQVATRGAAHAHGWRDRLLEWASAPLRNPAFLISAAVALALAFVYLRRRKQGAAAVSVGIVTSAFTILAVVSLVAQFRSATGAAMPSAPQVMNDSPRRLPDGTAFAAKPTQRLLDVRTVLAEPQSVRPAYSLIGRVIGDPNRTSIVQSVYGGRVIPIEGKLPRVGQHVAKGEPLIQIDPHLPLADRTTISEKVGEIEQLIAVAEARIRRLRPLAERGAVPQSQVSDLEIELEGLRARREAVRNSRSDRELLLAPTVGIITAAKVTPGQVIQPQDILLQIADPKGLWVEALSYGEIDLPSSVEATAVSRNGQTLALSYLGLSRELRQHASVVHFSIPEPPPGLNIGQPVTVLVQSGAPTKGLVFPRDAIVRSANGEAIVWLHVAPERFEPRPVRTLPLDASRVIVAAGLGDRERVVVRSADLINQIR